MEDIKTDQQVVVITKEVEPIQAKVDGLVIKDELSSKYATDLLAFVTKAKRRLEERRKFFVGPLNEGVKNINNEFKSLTQPLEEMESSIKQKMMSYMEATRAKAREEAIAKQTAMDKVAKDNDLPAVEVVPEEVRQVKSGIGAVHTTKRWTFKVVDETKIPREYFILDEHKISGLVRAHTKTIHGVSSNDLKIEGIEIYQTESIAIRA